MIERLPETQNWFNYIFLTLFILIVVLKEVNTTKFFAFLKLGWSDAYIKETIHSSKKEYLFVLLLLLYLLLSSLVVLIIYDDSFQLKNLVAQLEIRHTYVIIFSILILKNILQVFVGYVFNIRHIIKVYLSLKFSLLYYLSIISFIPILFSYYVGTSESIINFYFIALGIFYVVRVSTYYTKFRNLISSHLYYFILYICSFEIAPLLLFIWYVK